MRKHLTSFFVIALLVLAVALASCTPHEHSAHDTHAEKGHTMADKAGHDMDSDSHDDHEKEDHGHSHSTEPSKYETDDPADQTISVAVKDRKLVPEKIEVKQGKTITLKVATDEPGEFHLAGYEIVKEMDMGNVIDVTFKTELAGRYNVELHPGMAHAAHKHAAMEVPVGIPKPSVSLKVLKDPKSGWNAHITTTNFKFAPERVSTKHVDGEGHGHIYVNGKKINRIYSNWYALGELKPGTHTIRVTLNANSHEDFTSKGEVIEDSVEITIPEMKMEDHSDHSSHEHKMLEVSGDTPTVELEVLKDPKSGWNAHITTTNFKFAPERVSTEHIEGEGHGHIYVDGKKINRFYSDWYHLGALEPGQHTVKVTLNANSHEDLTKDEKMIADSVTFIVPPAKKMDMSESKGEDIVIGSLVVTP